MKNLVFLPFIVIFFVFSCTKETVESNPFSFTGQWQWVMSSSGIAGITITPASAGYERTLVFTADFKYSRYKNNILEKSGKFEIVQAKSIYKVALVDFIKFDDGTMLVIMSQTSTELILADNFYDGFSETYKSIIKQTNEYFN
jgi:hypothetical protein